jgi:hypothetical protein
LAISVREKLVANYGCDSPLKRADVIYPDPPVRNFGLNNQKTRKQEEEYDTKTCKMWP